MPAFYSETVVHATRFGLDTNGDRCNANALESALDAGVEVLLPPTLIRVDRPPEAGKSAGDSEWRNRLRGMGRRTKLTQYDSGVPVIQWGGPHALLADMSVGYTTPQALDSGGDGVVCYAPRFGCLVDNVEIFNAANGITLAQEAVYLGSNWIGNDATFRHVQVSRFSDAAVRLKSFNGGSGGLKIEGLFAFSRDGEGNNLPVNVGLALEGFSEASVRGFNLENCNPGEALYASDVKFLDASLVHFEQLRPRLSYGGLLHVDNSNVHVRGLDIYAPHFLKSLLGNSGYYSIARLTGPNSKLNLTGGQIRNLTNDLTADHLTQFSDSGATAASARIETNTFDFAGLPHGLANPSIYAVRDGALNPLGA